MKLFGCVFYSTLCLNRYQLLFASPLTFQSPSLDSGCVLKELSTPLQLTSTDLPSSHTVAGTEGHSQNTQAHARPYGWSDPSVMLAFAQDFPLSPVTSTRTIFLPPPLGSYGDNEWHKFQIQDCLHRKQTSMQHMSWITTYQPKPTRSPWQTQSHPEPASFSFHYHHPSQEDSHW